MTKQVIICVDDEIIILDSLKRELGHVFGDDYIIETAEGGQEALELLEEVIEEGYEVPLVISDYLMPEMKGDELLKRVHLSSPKTLKIMLTGQATLEAVGNAIKYAQLYRYIAKPWEPEDLKLTAVEAVNSYIQEKKLAEKNAKLIQLNRSFSRFVPRKFLQLLDKESISDVQLGESVQKKMSVLFSDIRNFTSLSETMTPKDNFKFINGFFSRMEPAIMENNGFIDKYIGDAIMALFDGSADDAVRAGIAMLQKLNKYNQTRQRPNRKALKIGIGINTGDLMLGTVGGKSRIDSTVISDAVNLASRLEALTKSYGISLLISQNTLLHLENTELYAIRFLDKVKVKGKSKSVTVYEVFDADEPKIKEAKLATKPIFEEAWLLYNRKSLREATELFEDCLCQNPNDTVAQIYLERCQTELSQQEQVKS